MHHLRAGRGIRVHLAQDFLEIVEGVMQELPGEKPRRALHDDALVHEVVRETRLVAAEEARHAVRPPASERMKRPQ
jgi:hypothetical protein